MDDQTLTGAQALALILPVVVPYVTAAIKTIWAALMGRVPKWLGPFKAIVAGWMVSGLSRSLGVPLPTDLAQITDDTTTAILLSGVVVGAMGAWIRDLFDSLKKRFDDDTLIGKAVRLLAGRGEADLLSQRGEVTIASLLVLALFSVAITAIAALNLHDQIDRSRCDILASSRLAPEMPVQDLRATQQACWQRFGIYLPWPD